MAPGLTKNVHQRGTSIPEEPPWTENHPAWDYGYPGNKAREVGQRRKEPRAGTEVGIWAEVTSPPQPPGKDGASCEVVAVLQPGQSSGGAGGGPEPGGAAGAEPALRRAAWAESG